MIGPKFCLNGYLPAVPALFLRFLPYIFHWEKNMIPFELGPTEIWTRIAGVQSANHYTIRPLHVHIS